MCQNYGNWFRHFEVINRICEPSNVVVYIFWPTLVISFECYCPNTRTDTRTPDRLLYLATKVACYEYRNATRAYSRRVYRASARYSWLTVGWWQTRRKDVSSRRRSTQPCRNLFRAAIRQLNWRDSRESCYSSYDRRSLENPGS